MRAAAVCGETRAYPPASILCSLQRDADGVQNQARWRLWIEGVWNGSQPPERGRVWVLAAALFEAKAGGFFLFFHFPRGATPPAGNCSNRRWAYFPWGGHIEEEKVLETKVGGGISVLSEI